MSEPRTSREALIAEMLGDIDKTFIEFETINKKLESINQALELATKKFLDASKLYDTSVRRFARVLINEASGEALNNGQDQFKNELKAFFDKELSEFTNQLKGRSTSFEKSEINSAYESVFFWACLTLIVLFLNIAGLFVFFKIFA